MKMTNDENNYKEEIIGQQKRGRWRTVTYGEWKNFSGGDFVLQRGKGDIHSVSRFVGTKLEELNLRNLNNKTLELEIVTYPPEQILLSENVTKLMNLKHTKEFELFNNSSEAPFGLKIIESNIPLKSSKPINITSENLKGKNLKNAATKFEIKTPILLTEEINRSHDKKNEKDVLIIKPTEIKNETFEYHIKIPINNSNSIINTVSTRLIPKNDSEVDVKQQIVKSTVNPLFLDNIKLDVGNKKQFTVNKNKSIQSEAISIISKPLKYNEEELTITTSKFTFNIPNKYSSTNYSSTGTNNSYFSLYSAFGYKFVHYFNFFYL